MKSNYTDWSTEDLIKEVKKLKKRKTFGLVWEDTPEEVAEKCKTHLPILKEELGKRVQNKSETVHTIIEGDNYHALSVLAYTHQNSVDFIYIDPPYNTGNNTWKYNNRFVNTDDSYRHSKWLAFMSKRLRLAKKLLKPDGVICVTIDDYEMPRLWMLMETIFGESNHLGTVVIRNNPKGRMTKRKFSLVHEYGVFFGKSNLSSIKKLPENPEEKSHNYKKDEEGNWYLPVNLRKQGVDSSAINRKGNLSERYYPIYYDPQSGLISANDKLEIEILPIDTTGQKRIWRRSKDVIDDMYNNGDLSVKNTKNGYQIYFRFRGGLDGKLAQSIWYDSKFSASEYGTKTLDTILGEREVFQYPKSPFAVKESILAATDNENAVILDFFAGSGTTGQAVLELNKDGGNRKFILCTNNEDNDNDGKGVAQDICYPRVKKVIEGYQSGTEFVEGTGGSLRYYHTSFVDQVVTDNDKREFVKHSTEMLCLAEDAFDQITNEVNRYALFENNEKILGIIYDEHYLDEFKDKVNSLLKPVVVYIFSYDNHYDEDEFKDLAGVISIKPIPEAILNVYKRTVKESTKKINQ